MRTFMLAGTLITALSTAACGTDDGATFRELERAAVERARQELKLPASTPLESTVWTGRAADGQLTFCGSVSSPEGSASPIRPQQFAAHDDPIRFIIFGPAHQADPRAHPGKFENWAALCANAQDA